MVHIPSFRAVEGLPYLRDVSIAVPVMVIGADDDIALEYAAALGDPVFMVTIRRLTVATLAEADPQWIVFSLISETFDATDAIERLAFLGYRRKVCVVAPNLPNRQMVEMELSSISPLLRVVLVETPT